jgi:peptide chain release factor 1
MESLADIRNYEGRGNELISIYARPDDSLSTVESMIKNEMSSLDNFDENTRMKYSVRDTLNRITKEIEDIDEISENGIVIFAGRVRGNTKILVISEKLEKPVPETKYVSGSQFATQEAEKLIPQDDKVLLVALDTGNCVIGVLTNKSANIVDNFSKNISSKHSKGGQSQSRFERRRKEQKKEFFRLCETRIEERIDSSNQEQRIFVSGPDITVKEFLSNTSLKDSNRIDVLGTTQYINEYGIQRMADEAIEYVQNDERLDKLEILEEFFSSLKDDSTPTAYGKEEIKKAIEYRSIDKLIVHNEKDYDNIINESESYGADTIILSGNSQKERMLIESFQGIGAILNYNF